MWVERSDDERGAGDGDAPTIIDADVQHTIKEEALVKEGAAHNRTGMRLTILGAVASAALLQLVVHKKPIHWVVTGLLVAIVAVAAYIHATAKDFGRPKRPARTLLGVLMSLAAVSSTAYLGVLSSTALLLIIVVWAFTTNDDLFEAWLIYLVCALGYLLLVALTFFGVMPLTDSVLALTKENRRALLGLTLLLEMLLGMVFWLAWTGRRATMDAIGYVARARVEVERRKALLDEARADLRQAEDAARHGRFTGALIGEYRAGEVIGRGAMGEVYAGEASDGRRVAIKVLHAHLIDSPSEVERFVRELRLGQSLDSAHIVRVLGTGAAPDGSPYLAMERLVGRDLATMLREAGRLEPREAAELVSDVAHALGTAEKAGIVHRDVKPQNLFRVEDGNAPPTWKVLDFGIARLVEAQSSLTHGVIGTPAYMAPEQVRGERVDHRADVFALAAVAYRALTGRPPFSGPDPLAVLHSVAHDQPAAPTDLAMLTKDVELVLALGLTKDPGLRFQSANELGQALKAALHNALDEASRQRARAILAERPWGSTPSA
jgi:serine/threonine-protein kinase